MSLKKSDIKFKAEHKSPLWNNQELFAKIGLIFSCSYNEECINSKNYIRNKKEAKEILKIKFEHLLYGEIRKLLNNNEAFLIELIRTAGVGDLHRMNEFIQDMRNLCQLQED